LPSSDVAGGGGEVAAPFQNWRAPPQQWRGDSAAAVYSDRFDVSWRARWSSIAGSSRRRKMQQCRSPMQLRLGHAGFGLVSRYAPLLLRP